MSDDDKKTESTVIQYSSNLFHPCGDVQFVLCTVTVWEW